MLYDVLILAGLVFAVSFLFIVTTDYPHRLFLKPVLQALVVLTIAGYLVAFWCIGGQTVGMRTWRFRLERRTGGRPQWPQALARLVLALLGMAVGAVTFWWALMDREKQFLHDRLAGTRLVMVPSVSPN
jgi:uncharacterized RDD family membrane protein YckC